MNNTLLLPTKTMFGEWIKQIAQLTHLPVQFVTFVFVGPLNTLVGYLCYAFFVWVGCNYIWAPFF